MSSRDAVVIPPAELAGLIQAFIQSTRQVRRPETAGTYERALKAFERWQNRPGSTYMFSKDDVGAYREHLAHDLGLQEVSVSTYLTAVRQFGRFLVERGYLAENVAVHVRGNRRPAGHSRDVLTNQEIGVLLESLDSESQLGRRDQAIIYLMLFAGLSEIELVRADIEDLEQTPAGWVLHVQSKGRSEKDHEVPVDPHVMAKIRLYLDTRRIRPDAPLFVSHGHRSEGRRLHTRTVRSRVAHYLRQADIVRAGISAHSLRHTAAAVWLQEGMSIDEVKSRMRHGRLATTMIYVRQSNGG